MRYNSYSEKDFLLDEYFQKWILDPDLSTRKFWDNWILKHPEKKEVVQSAAYLIRLMNSEDTDALSNEDFDAIWQNIIHRKRKSGRDIVFPRRIFLIKRNYALGIAATFVGFILSIWFVNQFGIVDRNIKKHLITESEVILKLGDGTVKVLDETSSKTLATVNGENIVNQKRNKLIYKKNNTKELEVIDYNKLIVPYGKTFELILSDGSQVLINSGSTIRYPVNFLSNQPRTVYLDGEAYFSVEKDKSRPFTVVTDDMITKVYGTKFNVSSYDNENNTSTVLIEGSVSVYDANDHNHQIPIKIKPGQRASLEKEIIVVSKVNVKKFIAWTDGKLYFSDDPFEIILKKLERHFNVNIENKVKWLNKKRFTGTFTKESLDKILSVIQEHTSFAYKVNGNTITITEKE